ncbi:hypothetical protein D6764_01180 [Candidatus Woesearchaeota archaeon]|nr:MAG: hypothetical protein D6764_01180 [Candidatus Woesearchaeota archaeon]
MTEQKIVFLGTGGDPIVVGGQIRASGGIIVRHGETQLHIDPGPGALVMEKVFGVNPRSTTAILCSHNHLNHANDLNAVISALTHSGLDTYGVLVAPASVIQSDVSSEGAAQNYPSLGAFARRWLERIIIVEPGKRVAVNEVDITASPTVHSDSAGVGFKIVTPDFSLGYTSDTEYDKSVSEAFRETDILILNVVAPFGVKVKGQLSSEDAARILSEVKPTLGIITHFGIKMLSADPLHEARKIQKESGVQTIAAKDGMTIDPVSYSARLKQKTLKHFK